MSNAVIMGRFKDHAPIQLSTNVIGVGQDYAVETFSTEMGRDWTVWSHVPIPMTSRIGCNIRTEPKPPRNTSPVSRVAMQEPIHPSMEPSNETDTPLLQP